MDVPYTARKRAGVYLRGHGATKDSHDRLLQKLEAMVRSSEAGYYDCVGYPGKSSEAEAAAGQPDADEPTDQAAPSGTGVDRLSSGPP